MRDISGGGGKIGGREGDEFGTGGCAGGVEEEGDVAGGGPLDICLEGCVGWGGDSEFASARAGIDGEDLSTGEAGGFERGGGSGWAGEEGLCFEVFEVEAEVIKSVAGVERSCCGGAGHAEEGRSHFRAVGEDDGDAIVWADGEGAEVAGVGLGLNPEAGVVERVAARGEEGWGIRGQVARLRKNLGDGVHLLEWPG